jgi:ribosomal 50S subunit-recycling heat shock protein
MRLDKYLSTVKVLKSRTLVKLAADEGMIYLNGKKAKASSEIKPGDIIEIDIPRFYKKFKVLALPPKNLKKSEAAQFHQLLEDRKKELI